MKSVRLSTLISALLLFGLTFAAPDTPAAWAQAVGEHVLTGELVATDAIHNRFRLVGHGGSFSAPLGTSVEALDGKPVQVEIGHDGRVMQIREMPIAIQPITHGFELVTGQLQMQDAARRTFTIVGTNRTYAAPPSIDVSLYAGHRVEVRLDEHGAVTDIRLAAAPSDELPASPSTCSYNGQRYAGGASVCQSGIQYRCDFGAWRNLGTSCAREEATASRWPRTCMIGGATIADGGSICRAGTTFRCVDGEWVNVKTPCS
jgi:hypothetical protein